MVITTCCTAWEEDRRSLISGRPPEWSANPHQQYDVNASDTAYREPKGGPLGQAWNQVGPPRFVIPAGS
jgi:hypothetical protein